jgi:hypothetical protein
MSDELKQVFDSDAACKKLRNHWLMVAEVWQSKALDCDCPATSLAWSSLAADAFWNATGESTGLSQTTVFDAYKPRTEGTSNG